MPMTENHSLRDDIIGSSPINIRIVFEDIQEIFDTLERKAQDFLPGLHYLQNFMLIVLLGKEMVKEQVSYNLPRSR